MNMLLLISPFYCSLAFALFHLGILCMDNAASDFLDTSFGAHECAYLYLGVKSLNHKIQICSLLVNNAK